MKTIQGLVTVILLLGLICPAAQSKAALGDRGFGAEENVETPQTGLQKENFTLTVTGNSQFATKDLLAAAAAELQMFEQKGFRKADIDDAAYQMRSAYLQAGFAFAFVDYTYKVRDDIVHVSFNVEEGPRVHIAKVDFTGNKHVSPEDLSALLLETPSASGRQQKMIFVESRVKDGLSRIRDYYLGKGFKDVRVEKPLLSFSDDKTNVAINIPIDEGPRYIVGEVRYSGDILTELAPELEQVKKDYVGKPYYLRLKLLLRSRLEAIYDKIGYAEAQVDIETVQLDQPGRIAFEVSITSGEKYRLSKIVITGNSSTLESFIRSRLQLHPGDLYTNAKRLESFRKLYDTGLFSRITIEPVPADTENMRDLEVIVEELPTREYYLEPGWGSYERLRLRAGILEKNLFGTGRNGRLDGLASTKGETVTVSYNDPWLLQTEISMNIPLTYERREEPSYTSQETGISLLFSRKFKDDLTLSAGYQYKVSRLYDLSGDTPLAQGDQDYNKGTVGIQAVYDTRDDIFYPAKGLRLASSFDISLPALGGDLQYGRITFGCRYFIGLPQEYIIGLRATTGLIIPLGDQDYIPISERFFNGGDTTVRSYKHSELGPKDENNEPLGGLGYNVFSVELRKRFYGNFAASLYVDAGNVSPNRSLLEGNITPYTSSSDLLDDTLSDFFSEFKFGIGIGLQYLLPVGPIRFDIAYNPDPVEIWHEDSWVYHFSLGMAF